MKLNHFAKNIIQTLPLGFVATVTPNGRPNLSPKGTFLVLNEDTIAFAHIRSPQTIKNIKSNPEIEVNFINQWSRKAIRISGRAEIFEKGSTCFQSLIINWQKEWPALADRIKAIVIIAVSDLKLETSPPYDDGLPEEEMIEIYKKKFRKIYP